MTMRAAAACTFHLLVTSLFLSTVLQLHHANAKECRRAKCRKARQAETRANASKGASSAPGSGLISTLNSSSGGTDLQKTSPALVGAVPGNDTAGQQKSRPEGNGGNHNGLPSTPVASHGLAGATSHIAPETGAMGGKGGGYGMGGIGSAIVSGLAGFIMGSMTNPTAMGMSSMGLGTHSMGMGMNQVGMGMGMKPMGMGMTAMGMGGYGMGGARLAGMAGTGVAGLAGIGGTGLGSLGAQNPINAVPLTQPFENGPKTSASPVSFPTQSLGSPVQQSVQHDSLARHVLPGSKLAASAPPPYGGPSSLGATSPMSPGYGSLSPGVSKLKSASGFWQKPTITVKISILPPQGNAQIGNVKLQMPQRHNIRLAGAARPLVAHIPARGPRRARTFPLVSLAER